MACAYFQHTLDVFYIFYFKNSKVMVSYQDNLNTCCLREQNTQFNLDIELDKERGSKVWEIDFEHGNMEYSYDVDSETGAITKVERERDR